MDELNSELMADLARIVLLLDLAGHGLQEWAGALPPGEERAGAQSLALATLLAQADAVLLIPEGHELDDPTFPLDDGSQPVELLEWADRIVRGYTSRAGAGQGVADLARSISALAREVRD